jgi:tetratricopeptide (TPR) repeat protein
MTRVCVLWLVLLSCLTAQQDLLEQADEAFRAGDLKQAQVLARKVLAQDPRSVHAHLILGVIAAQNKQWETSNRHFQSVVRLDPKNPHGYFYLGQASLYQQRWTQAIDYFSKALERGYPDRDRLMIELALAQNSAGSPQKALDILKTVDPPAGGPMAAQYHAVAAFAYGRLRQTSQALDAMRRARDLDDANVEYWEFLISTLIGVDQTSMALAEAIQAQKKFPDHPDILYLFGLASYYVPESPLTNLAVRNLREAEPEGARVLLIEGMQYRKQGRNDEAFRAFHAAADRGVPDARLLLGILSREAGDYEAAEREFREAERQNPENGQVLLELGKLLLSRGDLQEARARLEKASQYMPSSFGVHYQLGLVYRRLGEIEKADQHLRLSRELEVEQARASSRAR